jgi:hypothetical protein
MDTAHLRQGRIVGGNYTFAPVPYSADLKGESLQGQLTENWPFSKYSLGRLFVTPFLPTKLVRLLASAVSQAPPKSAAIRQLLVG